MAQSQVPAVMKQGLKDDLGIWLPKITSKVTTNIPPDHMALAVEMSFSKTPLLYQCSKSSIINAVIQCFHLGLLPDTAKQHCHLLPYKISGQMTCVLVPNYRGVIKLMKNSGEVTNPEARIVYENDTFSIKYGSSPKINHIVCLGERGRAIGAYSIIPMKDGTQVIDWMNADDMEKVKKSSRGASSSYSPWVTWTDEQWRKTVLKRNAKYVPWESDTVSGMIELDNKNDGLEVIEDKTLEIPVSASDIDESLKVKIKSKTNKLADKVTKKEPLQKMTKEQAKQEIADESRKSENNEEPPAIISGVMCVVCVGCGVEGVKEEAVDHIVEEVDSDGVLRVQCKGCASRGKK